MAMSELPPGASEDEIVARAGRYYRNARYLIVVMALGAGLWFGYDGFYNWPKQVKQFGEKSEIEQAEGLKPHSDLDITMQCFLALGLVPLAPILLGIFLYRSRGEYRLAGNTLHVPGHPPVPFEAITAIDNGKWKRKGILLVEYQLPDADVGRLTLDDFVYEQAPTDKIVERIEEWLGPEEPEVIDTDEAEGADQEIQENDV
jgi:hypothetical protein